jgi:sodium/hydrogen antiporter
MTAVFVVALLLVLYAAVSGRMARSPLTGPMLFVAAGVLLGPDALDVVHGGASDEAFRLILEGALVVVLFTDAASLSGFSRAEDRIPIRLLAIGMPMTIAFGWLVAKLIFPSMPLWEAALLGAVLAPTDAALGAAVIANPRVPRLIRDALNVESGLNDGLALPFATVFMALAAEALHGPAQMGIPEIVARSLVLSPVLGLAIGAAGAWAIRRSTTAGWVSEAWAAIGVGAIALAAYAATVSLDGSGFIAAWVAGFVAGAVGGRAIRDRTGFTEDVGALLTTIGFFAFGVLFVGPNLTAIGWAAVGYAVLSLTVVRMLPVAAALAGSGVRRPTVWYVGWFGPRGLASIVFMLLAIEGGARTDAFVVAVTVTVVLSVVLHGATAVVGSDRYARWFDRALVEEPTLVEGAAGTERPLRRRVRSPGSMEL